MLAIGDPCPPFDLPGTEGRQHTLADFEGKKVLVVLVSCNHCPYVVAYEPRIVAFAKEFERASVQVVCVNANDAVRYPDDGLEPMRLRAEERGFTFPYLRDDSQSFVRALGAKFTPEVFVFDEARALRYHGRIDDNHRDLSKVGSHDLLQATRALLAGKAPVPAETVAFGCSVKWK